MRRLVAIVAFVLGVHSVAYAQCPAELEFDIPFSMVFNGMSMAFPFSDLPEGTTQGGLSGTSGLSNPNIGGGVGFFTIPPQPFLFSEPATIQWSWSGGGAMTLKLTYYICSSFAPCARPRPKAKFCIKTKSVVLGVRG